MLYRVIQKKLFNFSQVVKLCLIYLKIFKSVISWVDVLKVALKLMFKYSMGVISRQIVKKHFTHTKSRWSLVEVIVLYCGIIAENNTHSTIEYVYRDVSAR